MKRMIAAAVALGAMLALPSLASAAPPPPPPTQDMVVLSGGPATAGIFNVTALNAASGPTGEDPGGRVALDVGGLHFEGPVTCLAVSGDRAILNFQDAGAFSGLVLTIQVVDDQPDTFDAVPTINAPNDCSSFSSAGFGGPLSGGDIKVVDAAPLPTTKEQCLNGAWARYGFKSQGLCVAFVERKPQG